MAAPLQLAFLGWNNETFSVIQPFPWDTAQWPLPAGSYFLSEARASAVLAPIALRFDSRDGSMIVGWDSVNNQVDLSFLQDAAAVAPLAGVYVFDVICVRPQGASPPRVDVIGAGTITINQGVTK